MTTITVVICAYTERRWSMLCRAVDSVQRQTLVPLQLILCIDHNSGLHDRCRQRWTASASHAGVVPVEVIANRYAGRLGSARNTAVELARGEIVAFLDDDAYADPDWLKTLAAVYQQLPDAAVVGGAPLPVFETPRPAWFPHEFDWVFGCAYQGLPVGRSNVRHLIGANMSARAETLRRVGGFHSDDHDDMDLCHRVAALCGSHSIVYEPAAVVRHSVTSDRLTWSYFWLRCFRVNRGKVRAFAEMGGAANLRAEAGFALRMLFQRIPAHLGRAIVGDGNGVRRASTIAVGVILGAIGHAVGRAEQLLRHPAQSKATPLPLENSSQGAMVPPCTT